MSSVSTTLQTAVQHHQASRFALAEQLYRQVLAIEPRHPDALHLLGVAIHQQSRRPEAIDYIRAAIEHNPHVANFHNSLGNALKAADQNEAAEAAYRRALELQPDNAEAHLHLGNTLRKLKRFDDAQAAYHQALAIKPNLPEAYNGLGNASMDQERHEEALQRYRQAVDLNPRFVEALNNLGTTAKMLGRFDEAIAWYSQAIEVNPDYPSAHFFRATTWLLTGQWELGWPAFEWRWRELNVSPRPFPQPLWDGSSLEGKTLFLHFEQGLGDTVQFVRFAPVLQARGARIVLECQRPLLALLASCPGIDELIAYGDPIPPFDVHASLLSVPRILRLTPDTVPANVPYLNVPPQLVARWRDYLQPLAGFRVGINWQGNPQFLHDERRSFALHHFERLAKLPGVRLISLQKGAGVEQLETVRDRFTVTTLPPDCDVQSGAFMDTAAVMKNLDLVITSCTATAHVAGALGVPTWLALQFIPDWRWLLHRSDTPWYPTMCLFRQPQRGNWDEVFQEMAQALATRINQ